jgi:hypothetical protein
LIFLNGNQRGTRAWRLESAAIVQNMDRFRGHSKHEAGRSMDSLDQDDPATGRDRFLILFLIQNLKSNIQNSFPLPPITNNK